MEVPLSSQAYALGEEIRDKGRQSVLDLPPLLRKAELLADDPNQDSLTRALAYRAAGNAQQLLNRFESALQNYNQSERIFEAIDDRAELGRTLHAKVGLLYLLNRFDELFSCSARARSLFGEFGDRKRLARLDVNLAHAHHRLGHYAEALECCEQALPVLEEAQDFEGYLAACINAAVVLTALHEFERAQQRYEQALKLAVELKIDSWVLLTRYNLAYLRYLNGESGEALKELGSLREEYGRGGDDRHVCLCWIDEAEILLEIGELEECIGFARKAAVAARDLGLNFECGKALLFEAAAMVRIEKNSEAVPLLAEANRRFEAEGNQLWTAVSRLQAILLRAENGETNELAEALAARALLQNVGLPHRMAFAEIVIGRIQRGSGDIAGAAGSFERAVSLADRSRSRWMQFHACYEQASSLAQQGDPACSILFQKAESIMDSLWNRIGSDDLKIAFLADRENVYTHLVSGAVESAPAMAFQYAEKARSRVLRDRLVQSGFANSVQAVQDRLSPYESVVEYFVSGPDLYIFRIDRDSFRCVTRKGTVGRVQEAWSNLERHFSSCSVKWEYMSRASQHLLNTARTYLEIMSESLIAPIAAGLREKIIFVPHAFLHNVPFHALWDGQEFLTSAHRVCYSPSAMVYCVPAPAEDFGPPLFLAFSRQDHQSSTISEVEKAAAHFADAEALINPGLREMQQAFETPRRLVHIAGHAGIDAVGGRISWIETADGRLTSRELLRMQIRARTLVVTGCQTAKRLIRPGDEWLGLMRAFYIAGASNIVSAFWDIRDEAAQRFSAAFYLHFDDTNIAASLKAASAAIQGWREHPYFWAGFGAFERKQEVFDV